jgi:tRNA modification GTPase
LREDPDRIEKEGIRRAREMLRSADAALWILDATEPGGAEIDDELPDDIPIITVRNKIDLTGESAGADPDNERVVRLSAMTGDGIAALRTRLRELAGYKDLGEQTITARRRHLDALKRAGEHFDIGRQALAERHAGEVFAEELRLTHQALGEITGATSSDDLLGKIFSEFCIGK